MNAVRLLPLAVCWCVLSAQDQAPVNPDSRLIDDFNKRIDDYMKTRNTVKSKMPALKPTNSPSDIKKHEQEFRHRLHEAREHQPQGSIFTAEISDYLRRRIETAMQGGEKKRVHQSLARSEPIKAVVRVNEPYPASVPLQSMPATLLLNLPKVPKEIDYRLVGQQLILRDVEANLVIDVFPNAIH